MLAARVRRRGRRQSRDRLHNRPPITAPGTDHRCPTDECSRPDLGVVADDAARITAPRPIVALDIATDSSTIAPVATRAPGPIHDHALDASPRPSSSRAKLPVGCSEEPPDDPGVGRPGTAPGYRCRSIPAAEDNGSQLRRLPPTRGTRRSERQPPRLGYRGAEPRLRARIPALTVGAGASAVAGFDEPLDDAVGTADHHAVAWCLRPPPGPASLHRCRLTRAARSASTTTSPLSTRNSYVEAIEHGTHRSGGAPSGSSSTARRNRHPTGRGGVALLIPSKSQPTARKISVIRRRRVGGLVLDEGPRRRAATVPWERRGGVATSGYYARQRGGTPW